MRAKSPTSFGVTFFQLVPPLRVTWISPSSDPVQITPLAIGDSAIVKTTPYVSTPVWSFVIGPPEAPSVFGSLRASGGGVGRGVWSPPRAAPRAGGRLVLLLRATGGVGEVVRRRHVIELRRREALRRPAPPAGE